MSQSREAGSHHRAGSRLADAEAIAIQGLAFLAAEPDRLGRFLAVTGLGPENLRSAAQEPGFLASVLDYVAGSEATLIELADAIGASPEVIARAHAALNAANGQRHLCDE